MPKFLSLLLLLAAGLQAPASCAEARALDALLSAGPLPAVPGVPRPSYRGGTVTGDVSIFALPYFLGGRRVWVYLPPGYAADPARRYPVLYMHDGQNLFDAAASYAGEWQVDESCENLILSGQVQPLIVVGIENGGAARMDEYTPWPDKEYGGGKADAYLAALKNILKPEIDRRYRTLPGAANTFMAGSSLGGLLSAYAGYTDPDTWGGIIALSPSYWWDGQQFAAWAAPRPKPALRFFYQDMGTREGGADPGVNDYIGTLRKVETLALAQGFKDGKDFYSFEAPGQNHSEASWASRFPFILKLLLSAAGKNK